MRRNPTLVGFTIGMPLVMLAIFSMLMGDQDMGDLGIVYKQYLAPRMIVLAILSSSFVSLATSVAMRRGNGELKRVRSTPMSAGVVLASLGIVTAALSLVSAGTVMVAGWWAFDLRPPDPLAMGLVLVVGCATSAAIGLAAATFIHRPDNAIAITNFLLWPVVFISGTYMWVSSDSMLDRIAGIFPVRHLNDAAAASTPYIRGDVAWWDLAFVASWGIAAAAVAVWRFDWEPARQG